MLYFLVIGFSKVIDKVKWIWKYVSVPIDWLGSNTIIISYINMSLYCEQQEKEFCSNPFILQ